MGKMDCKLSSEAVKTGAPPVPQSGGNTGRNMNRNGSVTTRSAERLKEQEKIGAGSKRASPPSRNGDASTGGQIS